MWNLKHKTNKQNKTKIHIYREKTGGCQRGGGVGGGWKDEGEVEAQTSS